MVPHPLGCGDGLFSFGAHGKPPVVDRDDSPELVSSGTKCDQVGRLYFARSPGSDVWVCFYDLPKAVCYRLRERVRAGDIYRDPSALAREAEWSRLVNELLEKRRRDNRA